MIKTGMPYNTPICASDHVPTSSPAMPVTKTHRRPPREAPAQSEIPFEVGAKTDVGPEVKFAYRVDTSVMVTARQIRSPVASPDGKRLAFTAFDRVWIKDMPDGEARRVSSADVGEYHPVWSPDGLSVAYVTWNDSVGGQIM